MGRNLGVADLQPHVEWLLGELMAASGLRDWHELDHLRPQERLHSALQRAEARYNAQEPSARALAPGDAIRALTVLVSGASGLASSICDRQLLESLPSLKPLAPLSPAIGVVEELKTGAFSIADGRFDDARATFVRARERLEAERGGGLEERRQLRIRLGLTYAIAQMRRMRGKGDALGHARELDAYPAWRPAAWEIRRYHHLWRGNLAEVEKCERALSQLELEMGSRGVNQDAVARFEAVVWSVAQDVTHLKACLDRLARAAALHPTLRPSLDVVRSDYERLRGNPQAALRIIESALHTARLGAHPAAFEAVGAHLAALLAVGDYERTVTFGEAYLEEAARLGLALAGTRWVTTIACAEIKLGDYESARRRLEATTHELEAMDWEGLWSAPAYEARARLAIATGDATEFEYYAMLCKRHYRVDQSAPLAARYERLLQTARDAGLRVPAKVASLAVS